MTTGVMLVNQQLRSVNFVGTQATGAHVHFFDAAGGGVDLHFLDVGRPTASGFSVRVTDLIAAHSAFSAYAANSGHTATSYITRIYYQLLQPLATD